MNSEVIKEFLVGLGFGVDEASLAKFNQAISSAAVRVTALYAGVKVAAAGIFYGISQISEGFEQMGYEYRIIAPAINKALMLRQALLSAYRAAGINITKVVQESVKFNFSLAKTKFALEALYKSVGARFLPLLTKQMDIFRSKIYANMPRIQAGLEKFIKFIFQAFQMTVQIGERIWSILSRVYDFFVKLGDKTNGWSTAILALAAAWKILNLGTLLTTPFGLLMVALGAAIGLFDDFMTYVEGGESLINWGSNTAKVMVGLAAAIGTVALALGGWSVISSVVTAVKTLNAALAGTDALLLIMEAPFWAIMAAVTALLGGLTFLDDKWQIFGGHLSGFFSGIGSKVMDFVAGVPLGGAQTATAAPLGVGQNGGMSQSMNQQTTINVNGVSDPSAAGNMVLGGQNRTNADMARNMKGAAR